MALLSSEACTRPKSYALISLAHARRGLLRERTNDSTIQMSSVYSRRTFESLIHTLAATTTVDMLMRDQRTCSMSGPRLSSGYGRGKLPTACVGSILEAKTVGGRRLDLCG